MTFRIGKIPVRVLPSFFLVTLLFNLSANPSVLAVWMAVVFVSGLLHELGHASAGPAFGPEPRIVLPATAVPTSVATAPPLPPRPPLPPIPPPPPPPPPPL